MTTSAQFTAILLLVAAGKEFTLLHTLDGYRAILSQPIDGSATAGDGPTPEIAVQTLLETLTREAK